MLREVVANVAKEWQAEDNSVRFDFGKPGKRRTCQPENGKEMQIRVSFSQDGYWSQLGQNSVVFVDQKEPSLNLGGFMNVSPDQLSDYEIGTIRHEFGHALGIEHEHQNPKGGCDNEYNWKLIYSYRPAGFGSNIGLLNGVMQGLGQDPVAWIQLRPWNNLFLMVIMIWMQVGFAMVVLSAAIKSVPDEIVEAARIDGASEWQVFRRILIPSILPTVVVVTTYMVINAMKVFDIVFVFGNAEADETEVIAERMLRWFFISANQGRGAAIAVVLFVAIIPVMIWNIRRFREEESIR